MSSGHRQDKTCREKSPAYTAATNGLGAAESDSGGGDDESLQEENTLSACLLRILQSGQPGGGGTDLVGKEDESSLQTSSTSCYLDVSRGEGLRRHQHYHHRPPVLTPGDQVDCRRLSLPHCQRAAQVAERGKQHQQQPQAGAGETGEELVMADVIDNTMQEKDSPEGDDKIRSWRAAGVALRRVLAETGGDGKKKERGAAKGKRECLKGSSRARCRRKEAGGLDGEASPISDDPMNMMLDEYRAEHAEGGELLGTKSTESLLAGVESVITQSEAAAAAALKPPTTTTTTATPRQEEPVALGLVTVRERIQQITSKINHNKTASSAAGGGGGLGTGGVGGGSGGTEPGSGGRRGHPHKYNRTTGPLQARSSSIGHGSSSSESEDEMDAKRHKMFVPRCRRVSASKPSRSSATSSSLTAGDNPAEANHCAGAGSDDGLGDERIKQPAATLAGAEGEGDEQVEVLSDLDSQEDFVTQKLQRLARQADPGVVSESDDTSQPHRPLGGRRALAARGCGGEVAGSGRLLAAETDSMPNLADIESSLHSDDNETLGESDLNDRVGADRRAAAAAAAAAAAVGDEDSSGKDVGEVEDEVEPRSAFPGWGSDTDGNWSEQGTLKRNRERGRSPGDRDFDGEADDLDEIENLVFDRSSPSDHYNEPVELPACVLSHLPDLSSGASASDDDGEADDEFECDCCVCQQNKSCLGNDWVTDGEEEILAEEENRNVEFYSRSSNPHPHVINMAELTPLDLLLMREGRRELLEVMFQNVIMQMLSVYPDLLGDQAPPPAPPTTIKDLPRLVVDSSRVADDFVCPICLCNFEVGEEARELPCHHTFHGLCIQAWLHKSGTCPVCRHILSTFS